MGWLRRNWHVLGAVLAISAVALPQISAGIGSPDAWGAIHSANLLVHEGRLQISRTPGHPTTDFLLLPAVAWSLSRLGIDFGSEAYLVVLWLAAVTSVVLFLLLLGRLGASRADSLLAAVALAITPSFLAQMINGEEMLWGLSLVLGSWLMLVPGKATPDAAPSTANIVLAGLLLALATGAREELVAMLLPMSWLLRQRARRPIVAITLLALTFAVSFALIWLLVVAAHPEPFVDVATPWRTKIAVAGYKSLFAVLPFPASIVIWTGFLLVLFRFRDLAESPGRRFIGIVWIIPLMFSFMFILYPIKSAYCLPGIAFMLLVLTVARRRAWVIAGALLLLLALGVRVDVFRDRVFTGPRLADGVWPLTVRDKTRQKLHRITEALSLMRAPRTIVVVQPLDVEMDWLIGRHLLPLQHSGIEGGGHLQPVYRKDASSSSALASRQAMDTPGWFRALAAQGYSFLIDAETYRGRWTPYAAHQPMAGDHVPLPQNDGSSVDCVLY